jgi:GMP synthase-like glutamine amidotransferase
MRALVIQHDHVSPPGPVGDRLVARGYSLDLHVVVEEDNFHHPHLHNPFPDLTGVDLVVTMGAPWSAYDDATVGAWVATELDLLRTADRVGVPVLGICFGGQLLAAAHGGLVRRSDRAEIGWVRIDSDDPGLVAPGPWFQWHFDRWVTPPQAREVARNEVAPQAFVLRRNLAVQFHPELTVAMLEGWYANGGDAKAVAAGADPARMLEQTVAEEPVATARAHALVDVFLDDVARPLTAGDRAPDTGRTDPRRAPP